MEGIRIQHDLDRNVVLFTVSGKLEITPVFQAANRFYARYPVSNSVWDLRDIVASSLSIAEMRTGFRNMADPSLRPTGARAALVVQNEADSGLAKVYMAMTETESTPVSFAVFYLLSDAFGWLGVDNPFPGILTEAMRT